MTTPLTRNEINDNRLARENIRSLTPAGFWEEMGATFEQSWEESSLRSVMDMWNLGRQQIKGELGEQPTNPITGKTFTDEEWGEFTRDFEERQTEFDKEQWKGSDYYREDLDFGEMANDQGMVREGVARILAKKKDAENKRKEIFSRSPGGIVRGTTGFAVALSAQAMDPLNIAASFIPVVGQARYARWLKAGVSPTKAKLLRGAVEGVVGNAMIEPVVLASQRQEQADYGMVDALMNVGFGGAIGVGAHGVGRILNKLAGFTDGKTVRKVREISIKQINEQGYTDLTNLQRAVEIDNITKDNVRQPNIIRFGEISEANKRFADRTEQYNLWDETGKAIRDADTRRTLIVTAEANKRLEKIEADFNARIAEIEAKETVNGNLTEEGYRKIQKLNDELASKKSEITQKVSDEIPKDLDEMPYYDEDSGVFLQQGSKEIVNPAERRRIIKEFYDENLGNLLYEWKNSNRADRSRLVDEPGMMDIIGKKRRKMGIDKETVPIMEKVFKGEKLTVEEMSKLYDTNKAIMYVPGMKSGRYSKFKSALPKPSKGNKATFNEKLDIIKENIVDVYQDFFRTSAARKADEAKAKKLANELQESIKAETEPTPISSLKLAERDLDTANELAILEKESQGHYNEFQELESRYADDPEMYNEYIKSKEELEQLNSQLRREENKFGNQLDAAINCIMFEAKGGF